MGTIFGSDGTIQDQEYLLRKAEYLKYIYNHVKNVRKGYDILFGSKKYTKHPMGISPTEWNDTVIVLDRIVNKHDDSKYTEEEFEPYRRHFYPTKIEQEADEDAQKKAEEDYEAAWEHHYRVNDHHPEYWKYIDDKGEHIDTPNKVGSPMSLTAVMHMFCDWFAMDEFYKAKNHADWYRSDASKEERECLNPETKDLIREMFMLLYGEDVSSVE